MQPAGDQDERRAALLRVATLKVFAHFPGFGGADQITLFRREDPVQAWERINNDCERVEADLAAVVAVVQSLDGLGPNRETAYSIVRPALLQVNEPIDSERRFWHPHPPERFFTPDERAAGDVDAIYRRVATVMRRQSVVTEALWRAAEYFPQARHELAAALKRGGPLAQTAGLLPTPLSQWLAGQRAHSSFSRADFYPLEHIEPGFPVPGIGLRYLARGAGAGMRPDDDQWRHDRPSVWPRFGYESEPRFTLAGVEDLGVGPITHNGRPVTSMGFVRGSVDLPPERARGPILIIDGPSDGLWRYYAPLISRAAELSAERRSLGVTGTLSAVRDAVRQHVAYDPKGAAILARYSSDGDMSVGEFLAAGVVDSRALHLIAANVLNALVDRGVVNGEVDVQYNCTYPLGDETLRSWATFATSDGGHHILDLVDCYVGQDPTGGELPHGMPAIADEADGRPPQGGGAGHVNFM